VAVTFAISATDELGQAAAFGAGAVLVLLVEVVLGRIMPRG
jgi:hypothetical protein